MNRRRCLQTIAGSALVPALASGDTTNPIQLHIELEVDPAKEAELAINFRNHFRPAIRKQRGFLDVKLLKMRKTLAGKLDGNWSYKLVLTFKTEEEREAWAKTDDHQKAWPTIAGTLTGRRIRVILYDVV